MSMDKPFRHRFSHRSVSPVLWAILLLSGILQACSGRPARKKMPDLTDLSLALEGIASDSKAATDEWPFYTSDTLILEGRQTANFLAVTLPFPTRDSVLWEMVKSWSVLSGPLLSEWAKMGKDGVLIDLRTHAGASVERADYILESHPQASHSIPIVLLWDAGSRNRAAYFTVACQSLPEWGIRLVGTSETGGQVFRQDCFQNGPPTLNNP